VRNPECPWYHEDLTFDKFDESDIKSTIPTDNEKFLLGVFPYGPNNQMRGFRDTIWGLKNLKISKFDFQKIIKKKHEKYIQFRPQ